MGCVSYVLNQDTHAPLFDFYHAKSMKRIRQDVYDRFFTRIEQRFSRAEILTLTDSFARVSISPDIPMWHFLCGQDEARRTRPPAST